ncbi:MAG: hypothetical protein WC974_03160 [Thermoplasmata archaeon]
MDEQIVLRNCEKFLAKKGSFPYRVCKLLKDGDFSNVLSSQELIHLLNEGAGKKIKVNGLTASMQPLLKEDIVKVKTIGKGRNKRNFWFPGWKDKKQVELNLTGKTSAPEQIFSEQLINTLGKDFEIEIRDVCYVYGRSGTCTAFLLRKILEKLIFLTFAKNGLSDKLKGDGCDLVGLKTMLNLATSNKIHGKPFLMPKTAKEIEGIKFLGDTSAHNPLINVEMKTIIPQMPFIITAYEELTKKL